MSVPPPKRSSPVTNMFSPTLEWLTLVEDLTCRTVVSVALYIPDTRQDSSAVLWNRDEDDLLVQAVAQCRNTYEWIWHQGCIRDAGAPVATVPRELQSTLILTQLTFVFLLISVSRC